MAVGMIRKAAVLLHSLSDEQAAALLGRLESEQAAAVAAEMAEIGTVAENEQEAVVLEFANAQNRGDLFSEQSDASPFDFLQGLDNDALVELIAEERTRIVALVLSQLPQAQAAEVLMQFDPSRQLEVLRLTAAAAAPDCKAALAVAQVLRRRLQQPESIEQSASGAAVAARILSAMPPTVERRLLGSLTEFEPALAREIRRAMFGDDVATCGQWDAAEAAG